MKPISQILGLELKEFHELVKPLSSTFLSHYLSKNTTSGTSVSFFKALGKRKELSGCKGRKRTVVKGLKQLANMMYLKYIPMFLAFHGLSIGGPTIYKLMLAIFLFSLFIQKKNTKHMYTVSTEYATKCHLK